MDNVLLITDNLDKSLYKRLQVTSRDALKGIDIHGQHLTQLLPEYISNGNTRRHCCGLRFDTVGIDTDKLSYTDFLYLILRARYPSRAVVEASIVVYRGSVKIDGILYSTPVEPSQEFLQELYEALSGDREVLDMLEPL